MSFWNAKIMQMSLAAGVYLNAISRDYVGKNGWAEGGDGTSGEGGRHKGCCRNNARNNKLQA